MPTPKVGQPCQFFPSMSGDEDVKTNGNTAGPIAAVITRVWNATCVNLIVFPDHGEPVSKGSVCQGDGSTGRGWQAIPTE